MSNSRMNDDEEYQAARRAHLLTITKAYSSHHSNQTPPRFLAMHNNSFFEAKKDESKTSADAEVASLNEATGCWCKRKK